MIKRRIIMGLLVLGTIGGFASGIRRMSCHGESRRDHWKDRVAETCVRAARNLDAESAGADSARSPAEARPVRRGER